MKAGGDAHLCLVQTLAMGIGTIGNGSGLKDSNLLLVFQNILCPKLTVGQNDL